MDSFSNYEETDRSHSPFLATFLRASHNLCLRLQHCKEFATYIVFYADKLKNLDIPKIQSEGKGLETICSEPQEINP